MRRLTAAFLAIAMMGLSITASADETEHYKDKFTSISWHGSDGTLPWSGPWSEIGDDGDEKRGNVRVVSSGNCSGTCMRMSALTTLLGSIGAVRSADTSLLEDVTLSYDIRSTSSLIGSTLDVQVNGGGGWVEVADYQLASGINEHATIDVSDFSSENFRVRFLFSGLLLSSAVFIDTIEILGTYIEPTTTTTTTTTTVPQTTTTTAPTTTTTHPTTTTSRPDATTSTSIPGSGSPAPTTAQPGNDGPTTTTLPGEAGGSTTSTAPDSSTTAPIIAVGPGDPGQGGGPDQGGPVDEGTGGDDSTEAFAPGGSGIRAAARGLQANFQGDLYGEVRSVSALNGVDFRADFSMAVEVIESSWAWIVLLGLVIAYSIISGLDRRREIPTARRPAPEEISQAAR